MGSTDSVNAARLTGEERFGEGASVLDFWRWALGDLRMNTARGFLAEYLVSLAVGSKAPIRIEWAAHECGDGGGSPARGEGERVSAELVARATLCSLLQLQGSAG